MQSNSKLKQDLGNNSRNYCYERTTKALLELGQAGKIESTGLSSGCGGEIGPWELQEEDNDSNNKNVLNSLNKINAAMQSKQQQQPSNVSPDEKQSQQQKRYDVSNLILKRRTLSSQRPQETLNENTKKKRALFMRSYRNEESPLRNYILSQVTAAVQLQQQSPPQRKLLSSEQLQQLLEKQQQRYQQQQQQQLQGQQNSQLQRQQQLIESSDIIPRNEKKYECQEKQQVQMIQAQQQELMRLKTTSDSTTGCNKSNNIINQINNSSMHGDGIDAEDRNGHRFNNSSSSKKQNKQIIIDQKINQESQKMEQEQQEKVDCSIIQQTNQDYNNIKTTEEFIQQQYLMNASQTSSSRSSLDNITQNPQQELSQTHSIPKKMNSMSSNKFLEILIKSEHQVSPPKRGDQKDKQQEYQQHKLTTDIRQQQEQQFKQYEQQNNQYQPKQQQYQVSIEDKMQLSELQRLETFKKNILYKCLSNHGQKPLLQLELLRNSKTSPLKKNNQKSSTTIGVNNNNNNNNNNHAMHVGSNVGLEKNLFEGTEKSQGQQSFNENQGSQTQRSIAAVGAIETNECNKIACRVVASVCETVINQPKQVVLKQQQQQQQEQIPDCLKKRTRSHHIPVYAQSTKDEDSVKRLGEINKKQPLDQSNILISQYCQTETNEEVKRGKKSSRSNNINNTTNTKLKTEGNEDIIVKRRIHSLYSQNIEAQLIDEAALIYHTNNDTEDMKLRYHGNTFSYKSNKPSNSLRNSELFKINRSIDIVHQLKQLQLTNTDNRKRIILNANNSNNNNNNRINCNMKIGNSKWEFIEETKNKKDQENNREQLKQSSIVKEDYASKKQGQEEKKQRNMGQIYHEKIKEIESKNQKNLHMSNGIQRYQGQTTTTTTIDCGGGDMSDSKQILQTSETKLTQQSMNINSLSNILIQQDDGDGYDSNNGKNIVGTVRSYFNSDNKEPCSDQVDKDFQQGEKINRDIHARESGMITLSKDKRQQRYCDNDESTNVNSVKIPNTSNYFCQLDQQDIKVDQIQQQSMKQSHQLCYTEGSRKRTLPTINSKSKSPERTRRKSQEGRNHQAQVYLEDDRCQLPVLKQIEQLSSQIQLSAAKKLKFKMLTRKNE